MSDELKVVQDLTPQMVELIDALLNKSKVVYEKTFEHKNCSLEISGVSVPILVDDYQLMTIGALLLPNIVNYLVNILPQFLYPYVVAYLQDLSAMREDPITINELYNYLIENRYGYFQFSSKAEGEEVDVQ